jgi:hypothetical protein
MIRAKTQETPIKTKALALCLLVAALLAASPMLVPKPAYAAVTFTLRFFANLLGEDEGKKFLGQNSVTTGTGGKVSFTFTSSQAVVGQNVTATNGGGNTSEFSDPVSHATE